jgi:hypothetical protein
MFESKINRGKANGYAPLDGSGKVPLDKLPPIQSTINTGSFVTINQTGSFATTSSNTFTGTQTITGSNGRLVYRGTALEVNPTLAEIHVNNDYPWIERFHNDTFSTSNAVMAYFGHNDGRFVFHNESTQSIGLQVNGFGAENGLLVYSDKVAFVNNAEISGSLVVSSTVVNNGIIETLNSDLIIDSGSVIVTGSIIVTGSVFADNLVGLISSSAQIITLGFVSGSYETTGKGIVSGSSQLTTAFPSKTTGSWTVTAGTANYSFTLDLNSTYQIWILGNVPNGIISYNGTVTISNPNVPVVGSQYAWNYAAGNALLFTSIPNQIVGTLGGISTTVPGGIGSNTNTFTFGITNNAGESVVVNYGYVKIS